MDFRLLGPLEVVEDDGSLALGGVKQRSLLAILLLHANQVVSSDRLIDELWGGSPPATAAKSIQVYVSRLRKVLDDGRARHARSGATCCTSSRDELDLARFERLAAEAAGASPGARGGQAERGARRSGAARRSPTSPTSSSRRRRSRASRRCGSRSLEQRIDADLALGHHARARRRARGARRAAPAAERLRYQLMLALYRSARQAEALEVYREARRELSEELGLEPSESLRQLEQAILRQDPSLDLPASGGAPGAASGARPRPTARSSSPPAHWTRSATCSSWRGRWRRPSPRTS